jgi:predicted DNA-binding transcriptional regulator YafY
MAGKRNDSLDTAILLLEILKRIPKVRKITAPDLQKQLAAEGLDRDIRTIQRHLETLAEHFELERDERTKPYGYRWLERGQGINVPGLTPQESLLLKLANQQLRALLPPKLMKSMAGFFEQAERNLYTEVPTNLERQWLKKVRVVATSQPLLPPDIKVDVFEVISMALFENRVLDVDYQNMTGWKQQARVYPLGLAQQGPRLYLVCRFDGYDNERSLAMHRVLKATASMETFEYPKDFDLAKYDEDGRFGFGQGERIRLSFKINKPTGFYLTETPLSKDQHVTEHPDYYEIIATVVESEMLTWWLRGFGENVWDVEKRSLSIKLPR